MTLARWTAVAIAALTAACTGGAEDDAEKNEDEVRASSRWNVNDVSLLFPKPENGSGKHLLSMKSGPKTLLPESVFGLLGDPAQGIPFLFEAPGRDKAWQNLRVTAVRVDPCFDVHEPSAATGCVRQVRLTAQLVDPDTQHVGDQSVHLFYPLDDTAFVKMLRGLRELKKENTGNPALGVHPVMKRQGLDGPFARKLKDLVLEACDASKLSRMTFMATGRSGNNWFWGVVDRKTDGTYGSVNVPMREGKTDGFTQMGRGDHDGSSLGSPLFPDELLKSTAIRGLSKAKLDAAVAKLQKIENPAKLSTNEMSCATCHVAAMTLADVVVRRGLDALPRTAEAFVAPAGQNVTNSTSPAMASNGRNMHAFSWFEDEPVVAQRVVNESARVAAFVATDTFANSLPAQVRAAWRAP